MVRKIKHKTASGLSISYPVLKPALTMTTANNNYSLVSKDMARISKYMDKIEKYAEKGDIRSIIEMKYTKVEPAIMRAWNRLYLLQRVRIYKE